MCRQAASSHWLSWPTPVCSPPTCKQSRFGRRRSSPPYSYFVNLGRHNRAVGMCSLPRRAETCGICLSKRLAFRCLHHRSQDSRHRPIPGHDVCESLCIPLSEVAHSGSTTEAEVGAAALVATWGFANGQLLLCIGKSRGVFRARARGRGVATGRFRGAFLCTAEESPRVSMRRAQPREHAQHVAHPPLAVQSQMNHRLPGQTVAAQDLASATSKGCGGSKNHHS